MVLMIAHNSLAQELGLGPLVSQAEIVPMLVVCRRQRSTGTRYEDCCCFSELMGDRVGASYSNGRIKGGSLSIKISRIEFDLKAK